MDLLAIVLIVAIVVVAVGAVVSRRRAARPTALDERVVVPSTVVPSSRLRDRLGKTRRGISDRLSALVRPGRPTAGFWSELADTLVAADMGASSATRLVNEVRAAEPEDGTSARHELERSLVRLLSGRDRALARTGKPAVIVVVGVNGSGKTTTVAKLAAHLQAEGATTVLGAADTFRAAAGEQLRTWAGRAGVDVVGGQEGADPASVAFDAYQAARARSIDAVIVDTAGRLHSKSNLMAELAKVVRVLRREAGEVDEVLLVLDGTTGQNAIEQARTFTHAVGVTGIVVTKLDGTARGGVVVAIEDELEIPVKFIGVGESMEDLVPFDPEAFVDALLGE